MTKKQINAFAAQSKRLAISKFWMTRADLLERQAVALFRESGVARESAKSAMHLTDDGAESVFKVLTARAGFSGEVKTVVEPEDGTGEAN